MKINSLTIFSAGLLISTSIFSVAYFSLNDRGNEEEREIETVETHSLPPTDTMITELQKQGFVVIKQEEVEQGEKTAKEEAKDAEAEKGNQQKEESKNTDAEQNKEQKTEDASNGKPVDEKASSEENAKGESTAGQANEEAKNEVLTITVNPGMTSYDVGQQLAAKGFIDMNAFSFSKEVEKRGLAEKLQLGQYEVKKSMTVDEIISLFFR